MALWERYRSRRRRVLTEREQHLIEVDLSWLNPSERAYVLELMKGLYKEASPQQITEAEITAELRIWGMVEIPGAKPLAFQPDWVTPLHISAAGFQERFSDGFRQRVTPSSQLFELHYTPLGKELPTVRLAVMKSAHSWGFRAHTLDGVRSFRWERVESVVYGTGTGELDDYRYSLFAEGTQVHMRRQKGRQRLF